ncbi:MAG: VCBS repeat-containing protein [Candidatus Sulfotelmatobacter sp.]
MRTIARFILALLWLGSCCLLCDAQTLPLACSAQQLTSLCDAVPSDNPAAKPAESNPPPAPGFIIKSYQGRTSCLDYSPEKDGSPIFLNSCDIAHPVTVKDLGDGNHTVILHAGSMVIGVPNATTVGAELPLALLTPTTTPYGNPYFFLDGDSIILASNRDMVAKVENARGVAGTPIVIGARNIADNEFWDFVATDGSDIDPTSGFIRVGYPGDPYCANAQICTCRFIKVVDNATAGTVVKLGTSLDLTDCPAMYVQNQLPDPTVNYGGITIRGDRRDAHFNGPELIRQFDDTGVVCFFGLCVGSSEPDMFDIEGDDVRLTQLNIKGPGMDTTKYRRNSTGVMVLSANDTTGNFSREYLRTIIDNNNVLGFPYGAIRVNENQDICSCDGSKVCPGDKTQIPLDYSGLSSDPDARPTNIRVERNLISYNRTPPSLLSTTELGYGVESEHGGFPLIMGNTFYSNRHAIAGDGRAKSGYRAFNNLVLSAAPLQHDILHTQDFDMHGVGDNGFGGIAGDYVGVFQNTFLGTNRPNLEIRGTTCNYIDYAGNISLEDEGDAISLSLGFLGGTPADDLRVPSYPPQFDHSNPTLGDNALRVGDFDGDGYDDLFLATGAAWYYSPGGKADWRFLSAKEETNSQLLFGDFDGDGRTDVATIDALGRLVVSWGGISDWDVLNADPTGGRLLLLPSAVSDMTAGDFDGNGIADVFWADGATWWVSYGGTGTFQEVQTSVFRIPQLRFGDFNGDGRTDVFSVGRDNWQVSYAPSTGQGLFTSWQELRPKLTDTVADLFVADLNGDGFADVFTDCPLLDGCWRISYYGFQDWESFSQPELLILNFAGVGHFLGQSAADVLTWNAQNFFSICDPTYGQGTQLCISAAGFEPATHYSLQDMR